MFLSEAAFPEILKKNGTKVNVFIHHDTILRHATFYFFFYHSWAIASCAVSRWSWSTSISDATKVLAKIKVRKEKS